MGMENNIKNETFYGKNAERIKFDKFGWLQCEEVEENTLFKVEMAKRNN